MKIYQDTSKEFVLETQEIDVSRSMSTNRVRLMYCGQLPQVEEEREAAICFIIKPNDARIFLEIEKKSGGKDRIPIEAESAEIKNLMHRFFFEGDQETVGHRGLSPYWKGVWTAHYIDWERTV